MAKPPAHAIDPTREADYPQWYQEVVKAADLAEVSPVRGCMVIKPWGYSLWENMQRGAGPDVQGNGARKRLFSAVYPDELSWKRRPSTWKGLPRSVPW